MHQIPEDYEEAKRRIVALAKEGGSQRYYASTLIGQMGLSPRAIQWALVDVASVGYLEMQCQAIVSSDEAHRHVSPIVKDWRTLEEGTKCISCGSSFAPSRDQICIYFVPRK